jgi:hypothetical protein
MANDYKSNPITLDTFSSDIDIAFEAFKISKIPVHIKHITVHDLAVGDHAHLLDADGRIIFHYQVATGTDPTEGIVMSEINTYGLKFVTSLANMTNGRIYIYLR